MQSKHLVYLFGGYVVATLCEMSQYACVCVCVHVIYGSCWPSSELEALGTNVDDERLDIEGESSGS